MNLLEMLSGLIQGFESAEPGVSGSNASVAVPAPQTYHLVLQAVGRTAGGKKIAADKAGVAVTDRGFIHVDIQWVPTRWTSARPSTRIRHWAKVPAWQPRLHMAVARTCRRRESDGAIKKPRRGGVFEFAKQCSGGAPTHEAQTRESKAKQRDGAWLRDRDVQGSDKRGTVVEKPVEVERVDAKQLVPKAAGL